MASSSSGEISQLLQAWNDGDEAALEKLMPMVNNMARHCMARESPVHTLQTTAMVNEAYLRLVDSAHNSFQNRIHFLAVCAQAMRRILVDWGRKGSAVSPGRGFGRGGYGGIGLCRKALAKVDSRKSQLVELRFFVGLKLEETAEVLKDSSDTVQRGWKMPKNWLRCELSGESLDAA